MRYLIFNKSDVRLFVLKCASFSHQVRPCRIRIGALHYDSSPDLDFDLTAYSSGSDVQDAISRIKYTGGSTHTSEAIESIRNIRVRLNYILLTNFSTDPYSNLLCL